MKKKYRSKLEAEVAKKLPKSFIYEFFTYPYWMSRNYVPDFSIGKYLIEVKGFFRSGDQAKYIAIHEQTQEDGLELIFILQKADKPVRKGAKLTMAGWCDKNGIKWFGLDDIPALKRYVK